MFRVHWGEPTGPGRTWPLSLFSRLFILSCHFIFVVSWFDALGLNVFLLSATSCLIWTKDGWDDNSCFSGFQWDTYFVFIQRVATHIWRLVARPLQLGQFCWVWFERDYFSISATPHSFKQEARHAIAQLLTCEPQMSSAPFWHTNSCWMLPSNHMTWPKLPVFSLSVFRLRTSWTCWEIRVLGGRNGCWCA